MKMTEITPEDIKSYLRTDGDEEDGFLKAVLEAAKQYIRAYTGQTDDILDTYEDIPIAVYALAAQSNGIVNMVYALAADMYDVRQATVSNDKENPTVAQILGSYSINLLG